MQDAVTVLFPKVMTALSVGDVFREIMHCAAVMNCAATTTGSTVPWGAEAWPPVPVMRMSRESEFAVTEPGAHPTVPAEA